MPEKPSYYDNLAATRREMWQATPLWQRVGAVAAVAVALTVSAYTAVNIDFSPETSSTTSQFAPQPTHHK